MFAQLRHGLRLAMVESFGGKKTSPIRILCSSYSSHSGEVSCNSRFRTPCFSNYPHDRLFAFPRLRRHPNDAYVGRRNFVQVSPTELYDVMGLSKKATSEEIKATYFKLSKIYHPDVCKDPAGIEKFVLISKAYEVLGNEEKRREYDRGIYGPDDSGQGAARAAAREFSQEEVLRYQEIFNQHHDMPKAKRSQFVQKGKRHGVYNFDEYYKQHYTEEREHKDQAGRDSARFDERRQNAYVKREKEKVAEGSAELSAAKKAVLNVVLVIVFICLYYSGVLGRSYGG